jgi:hypothetical protein
MAKRVFSGLVTDWRLAGWPTRRSPESLKATMEGVVRAPSVFSMTLGSLPSMTATQELVVPRSIPITLLIIHPLCSADHSGSLVTKHRRSGPRQMGFNAP